MADPLKEFEFLPTTGPLKLLGYLSILLGPITLAFCFSGEVTEVTFPGALRITGSAAPYALALVGFCLILSGIFMVRGAAKQEKDGGRIALFPKRFLVSTQKTGTEGAIYYTDISDISVAKKGDREILTLRHKGGTLQISSDNLISIAAFHDMVQRLREQVETARSGAHEASEAEHSEVTSSAPTAEELESRITGGTD
jgi:hypothetical protein